MPTKNAAYDWITGKFVRREVLKRWNKLSELGETRLAYKLGIVRNWQLDEGYSDTPSGRGLALREVIQALTNELKPRGDGPDFSEYHWRMFAIIEEQYIKGRAVPVLLGEMGISKSTYYREQKSACDLLAETIRQAEAQYVASRIEDRLLCAAPLPLFHNLLGRDDLIDEIKQALMKDKRAALLGLPGVGKTALATWVIYDPDLQMGYPDGVLWASSGCSSNVFSTLGNWAAALNIQINDEISSSDDLGKVIRDAIGSKRFLIVVDDVWKYEDALAFQVGGNNCAFLLTTRFPEVALRFAAQNTIHVSELSEEEGLALLTHLAPKAVEMAQVESSKLVKAVGSLPLALVLIGNYLRIHSYGKRPRTLQLAIERLHKVGERFKLKEPQTPSAPHPSIPKSTLISLQSTIGISFENLDRDTRWILLSLSIFPPKTNTFSEEAAIVVSEGAPEAFDKLVLRYGILEASGPDRYTLHQTIADFARLKLRDQKPAQRMVMYYTEFVAAHQNDFKVLDQEIANVLAALQIALEIEMFSQFIQCINTLYWFWQTSGQYITATDYLHQAIEIAKDSGDDSAEALCRHNLGRLAVSRGKYKEAEKLYKEALSLAKHVGDHERICACQQSLGTLASRRGDLVSARRIFQDALDTAHQLANPDLVCGLLLNMGVVSAKLGELRGAEHLYLESLALAREKNNQRRINLLLHNLGGINSDLGDHAQAEAYYHEAWETATNTDNQERICTLLGNMGIEAYLQGHYQHAGDLFQEGLDLAMRLEHQLLISQHHANIGVLSTKLGKYKDAREALQKGLTIAHKLGESLDICWIYNRQGDCYLQEGNLPDAHDSFSNALAIAENAGFREQLARAYFGLAQVEQKRDQHALSVEYAQKSLSLFSALEHRKSEEVRYWLDNLYKAGQV